MNRRSRKCWSDEQLRFRILNNRSDRAYWANIRELRGRANPALVATARRLAISLVDNEKIAGIDLLAQSGRHDHPFSKQALAIYFKLLPSEENPVILASLLHAISHNNHGLSAGRTKLVASFATSLHPAVRAATVHAMLGLENSVAIEAMIRLSTDKVAQIRNWTTFGLGELQETDTEEVRDALWARVSDRHQDTRAEAIRGLAKRGDLRVKPIIKNELSTGKSGALLFDAIAALNDSDFLPELKRMQRKYRNNNSIDPDWLHKLDQCIQVLSGSGETAYDA